MMKTRTRNIGLRTTVGAATTTLAMEIGGSWGLSVIGPDAYEHTHSMQSHS
jgi:hypothetical protein